MAASVSEIGSSYISAVDWYILSKFSMKIDFQLLKQLSLTGLKIVENVVEKLQI